jgi:hypothetical protein
MMNRFLRSISRLGPVMGDLVASAAGCFVFTRGFRLVAMGEEESGTESPVHGKVRSPKLLAGIGAAIFLLFFIASETLATVVALRH